MFPLPIIPPQARPVHRSPAQKYRFLCLFRLLGSIFSPSGTRFKNDFKKTSKKVRKSRILASPNPPKTYPKCIKMPSKSKFQKTSIFSRYFIIVFAFVLSSKPLKYAFSHEEINIFKVFAKILFIKFLRNFLKKTYQKPFQNEA